MDLIGHLYYFLVWVEGPAYGLGFELPNEVISLSGGYYRETCIWVPPNLKGLGSSFLKFHLCACVEKKVAAFISTLGYI